MQTQTITKNKIKLSYQENLAWSLLAYATTNEYFLQFLQKRLSGIMINEELTTKVKLSAQTWLIPHDLATAQQRLDWLLEQPSNREKQNILQILASSTTPLSNEILKPLIIGIVGMAIIGPTLGILNKRKTMTILVDKKLLTSKDRVIQKTIQASHGLISSALKKTKGETNKLEPDITEWLFGERETRLYASTQKDLQAVKQELVEVDVLFSSKGEEKNISVLAISPAANTDYLNKPWEKINN